MCTIAVADKALAYDAVQCVELARYHHFFDTLRITIPELCSILDNRYLCCMISLFELKLPIIFGKKICKDAVQTIQWMNLAPISRNNGKNEPSRCQLILRYLESSIPLLCGALILQYHFKSSSTPVCAHFLCRSRIREAGGEVDLSTSATRQQCWP